MKFILFTYDCQGCGIALKMKQEGHDVLVGQIQNQEDILLPEQLKSTKPEQTENKEKRLSRFDGLLKKTTAKKLLQFLQSQKPTKDWFIFMDLNYCWKFGEVLKDLGFQGNFPTQFDRTLEVKRDKAKEFVQKFYPSVRVAEYNTFKKVKEGINFLKKSSKSYVLKSLGDAGDTFVPKSDNIQELLGQLKSQRKDYEQVGFILEERIDSPMEITPQIVFWEGKPVYYSVDIENKPLFDGNIGPNTGCAQNLIIKSNSEDNINKIAFPPIVETLASQRKGMFIWDVSLLFDKSGTPYFGEFCSGRPGWDALMTEIAMSGDPDGKKIVTPYFQKLIKGENPLIYEYGAAVRLFNISEGPIHENIKIIVDPDAEPDVYLYDAKKQNKDIVTTGYEWDAAVVTGVGKTAEEAIKRAYEYVSMVNIADAGYRSEDDFLSENYETSILNRLKVYEKVNHKNDSS